MDVKIRFNTDSGDDESVRWRVLVDGIEHKCHSVQIDVPCETTKDYINNVGDKWHISFKADEMIVLIKNDLDTLIFKKREEKTISGGVIDTCG